MDNLKIDITSEGKEDFYKALSLFNAKHVYRYKVELHNNVPRMILYWTDSTSGQKGSTLLPFRMELESFANFAYGWLDQADYGIEPDHDGSNGRGWRIYNEGWTKIGDEWGSFVAIEPCWAWYGK